MKYLLILLALVSSAFSQLVPGDGNDTLLQNLFEANGYTWPHPQDSNFVLTYYNQGLIGVTIKHKNFTTLTNDICKMFSVGTFDFTGNAITALPSGMNALVNLRVLKVDSNALSQIPSYVTTMTWLTYLGASHNRIVGFNAAFFAAPFSAQVAFSYNMLGCNPDYITTPQKNYLNAHDVNPGWLSTQDCNPVATAIQTAPGAFRMAYFPNPFTTTTTIAYDLPGASNRVHLAIYDVTGALVKTLVDATRGQGRFFANFEGFRSGVYFSRAVINGQVFTQKLFKVK